MHASAAGVSQDSRVGGISSHFYGRIRSDAGHGQRDSYRRARNGRAVAVNRWRLLGSAGEMQKRANYWTPVAREKRDAGTKQAELGGNSLPSKRMLVSRRRHGGALVVAFAFLLFVSFNSARATWPFSEVVSVQSFDAPHATTGCHDKLAHASIRAWSS